MAGHALARFSHKCPESRRAIAVRGGRRIRWPNVMTGTSVGGLAAILDVFSMLLTISKFITTLMKRRFHMLLFNHQIC